MNNSRALLDLAHNRTRKNQMGLNGSLHIKERPMPIFEYQCDRCKTEFEKLVFTTDDSQVQCPECKGTTVSKKMSATGFTGSSTCSSGGLSAGLSGGGGSPFS